MSQICPKVIFTWSPADHCEQKERNVLFVSEDICGEVTLRDKQIKFL